MRQTAPTLTALALSAGEIRRQAIGVLSDGEDTSSRYGFDDVLKSARAADVMIYTIRVHDSEDNGPSVTPEILKRVHDADTDVSIPCTSKSSTGRSCRHEHAPAIWRVRSSRRGTRSRDSAA